MAIFCGAALVVGLLTVGIDTASEMGVRTMEVRRNEAVVAEPDDDKISCRRVAITGTMFRKRICKTQAEWQGKVDGAIGQGIDYRQSGPYEGSGGPPPR